MRRPWHRTSEEVSTNTSYWCWQPRNTPNKWATRLCHHKTQTIYHHWWGPPKRKHSEPKGFDKKSAIQKINRRGRIPKKPGCNGGATILPVPTGDQLTGFGQVSRLAMLQHIFTSYEAIDKIDLEENGVNTMEPYDPTEHLARLIKKLGKAQKNCTCRREHNFWRDDGVQRDKSFGIDGQLLLEY